MAIPNSFDCDLKTIEKLIYNRCHFEISNLKISPESKDYSACTFDLNGKIIQYRVAKITPTKIGQFVTIWKRNQNGITEPFDVSDDIDFIIITTKSGDNLGQFIFPKIVLVEKGILSQNGKSGKRGIRVYPSWDIPNNKQALKTQNWQLNYFLTIKTDDLTDLNLAKKLLNFNY